MREKRKCAKILSLVLAVAILVSSAFGIMSSVSAYTSEEVETSVTNDIVSTSANGALPTFSWDNATVYYLMTDRFNNGDESNDNSYNRGLDENGNEVNLNPMSTGQSAFQGGDFAGIIDKLEEGYFTDLGINAIWMSAPYEQVHGYVVGYDNGSDQFPHYAYHGYHALDFTETDDNWGTKEEFGQLVDLAHSQGIRIVLDIVINHSGYHSMYDMNEYGFGTLNSGWEDYYYSMNNFSKSAYNSKIGFSSSSDWGNWWGGSWVRLGLPGYSTDGGDVNGNLAGLPDFKTGDTNQVSIPTFLQTKWTQEGTYDDKIALYGESNTVSGYLIDWVTQWVRDYGIDGFRVDTVKHVEMSVLNRLSQEATQALKEWKAENHTEALDDLEFWMTGEHWDHGVDKSNYFNNGFDSMINFDLQKGFPSTSSAESTFSYYANTINNDPNFNVLSYASSHDTSIMRGDQIHIGSVLMMMPGGIEIFYGDETNRPSIGLTLGAGTTPGHHLRSFMNWETADQTVLEHWQKVGQFRNNHLSIGAGQHSQISAYNSSTGYTFSRTYDDGTNQDEVVVTLFAPKNQDIEINVKSIFADGEQVVNAYDDTTDIVENGMVTFNTGEQGTVLVESPRSSILLSLKGAKKFENSQEIEVSLVGAKNATVTIDNGTPFTVIDGETFTIGENTALGGTVNVSVTASNEVDTVTKEYTYEKIDPNAIIKVYYDNSGTNWASVNVHYWSDDFTVNTTWPGQVMAKNDDGIYELELPEGVQNVIFSQSGVAQTDDLKFNENTPLYNSSTSQWEEVVDPIVVAKEDATNEINEKFATYNVADYTTDEYTIFTNIKDLALQEIEDATTIQEVVTIKDNALIEFNTAYENTVKFAKDIAISEVNSAFNVYVESDYSVETYAQITSVKTTAINNINSATTKEEISSIKDTAILDMKTISDNALQNEKDNAVTKVINAYNSYDESLFTQDEYAQLTSIKDTAITNIGVALNYNEIIAIQEKSIADMETLSNNTVNANIQGVKSEIETEFAKYNEADFTPEDYALITATKDNAIKKLNSATTMSELNVIKNGSISEMATIAFNENMIYFDLNGVNWSSVNVYSWNEFEAVSPWPGNKMDFDGTYYTFEVSKDYQNIIFNGGQGSTQTSDLTVDGNLFTINQNMTGNRYLGTWSIYEDVKNIAMAEIYDNFNKYNKEDYTSLQYAQIAQVAENSLNEIATIEDSEAISTLKTNAIEEMRVASLKVYSSYFMISKDMIDDINNSWESYATDLVVKLTDINGKEIYTTATLEDIPQEELMAFDKAYELTSKLLKFTYNEEVASVKIYISGFEDDSKLSTPQYSVTGIFEKVFYINEYESYNSSEITDIQSLIFEKKYDVTINYPDVSDATGQAIQPRTDSVYLSSDVRNFAYAQSRYYDYLFSATTGDETNVTSYVELSANIVQVNKMLYLSAKDLDNTSPLYSQALENAINDTLIYAISIEPNSTNYLIYDESYENGFMGKDIADITYGYTIWIKAPKTSQGATFVGWYNVDKEVFVSYENEYKFVMTQSVNLVPIYSDNEIITISNSPYALAEEPIFEVFTDATNTQKIKYIFPITYFTQDDITVVEYNARFQVVEKDKPYDLSGIWYETGDLTNYINSQKRINYTLTADYYNEIGGNNEFTIYFQPYVSYYENGELVDTLSNTNNIIDGSYEFLMF